MIEVVIVFQVFLKIHISNTINNKKQLKKSSKERNVWRFSENTMYAFSIGPFSKTTGSLQVRPVPYESSVSLLKLCVSTFKLHDLFCSSGKISDSKSTKTEQFKYLNKISSSEKFTSAVIS